MNNTTAIVAVVPYYWGKGKDAEEAIGKCWQAGASGSQNVLLYAYSGPENLIGEISVNGVGDIEYPQGVTSIRVGMVKTIVKKYVPKK